MSSRGTPIGLAASLLLAAPPTCLLSQTPLRPWQPADYYKLVFVGNPRLAPDGRRVAFPVTTVVEDKDRRHTEIWMAPVDGSAPPTRYTSPATEAASPVWSPDGTLLAFTSKREGFEDDVWFLRTTPPGGEAFQIRGVHASPRFSADGRRLLYGWRGPDPDSAKQQPWRERVSPTAITRGPDPKRFDGRVYTSLPFLADERGLVPPRETRRPSHLYVLPLEGGEPRQLTSGALSQTEPDWSPDGSAVLYVEDPTDTIEVSRQSQPQLWLLSLSGGGAGAARHIETGYIESRSPTWSPDGRTIAFICSKGRGEENDVCAIPAASGPAHNLTSTWPLDPQSPTWSPDGKTIYFGAESRGNVHLFAVDAAGGPVRQVTSGERTLAGFSLSRDGKWLAYTASDVTHPAELFVAPAGGGGAVGGGGDHRLTSFNDTLLSQIAIIPADTFWYTSGGGVRIEGWLMKPYGYRAGGGGSQRYPLVLSIHGGPHSNYGNIFIPEFQMLSGQGYWLLFTNPRGSSGYGHDFMYATRGRWGMEDYDDLMRSVDVAIARGGMGVDTTRLAVLGGSYGGFMTNWVVGHTNRFAVAETDRSIFNWHSWYGSSDAQGLTDYEFAGRPWERDSVYRVLSPMQFASGIRTPMLIVHSEDDRRTPIANAEQLFVTLRERGVPAEFVRYPRSFHGLSRTGPPWLLVDRLERIRTWFAHWIGTGTTPPAAAGAVH